MCGLKTALARHLIQSAQGKAGTRWAFPLKFCPPCAAEGIGLARTAHSDGGPPYAFYSAPPQGGSYPGGIPGAPAQKTQAPCGLYSACGVGNLKNQETAAWRCPALDGASCGDLISGKRSTDLVTATGGLGFIRGAHGNSIDYRVLVKKTVFVQPQLKRFHQTVVLGPVFAGPSHGENRSGENCFGCGADIKFQDHDSNW